MFTDWTECVMSHHIQKSSTSCLFKYNFLTFMAINLSQSPYLSCLIKSSNLTCHHRLSVSSIHPPKKALGRHGFATTAPVECNRLQLMLISQQTISSFRSQLEKHLSDWHTQQHRKLQCIIEFCQFCAI